MQPIPFRLLVGYYRENFFSRFARLYPPVYHAVHYTVAGRFSLSLDGVSRDYEGPVLWTGYPGLNLVFTPHATKDAPVQDYGFGMTGALSEAWFDQGVIPREPIAVARNAEARQAARELVILYKANRDSTQSQRLMANLVERLLLVAAARPAAEQPLPQWYRDLELRVRREPSWQPDWQAFARRFQLPVSTLRKQFQHITGKPPQRWLIERRMAKARDLLSEGRRVREVAQALGYADVFFFSRQFRTWNGVSPSAFASDGAG